MNAIKARMGLAVGVLLLILTAVLSKSSNAMRCGNELIMEGDNQQKVLQYCGIPALIHWGDTWTYVNYEGHGMTYTIHFGTDGLIDSINFSRGAL